MTKTEAKQIAENATHLRRLEFAIQAAGKSTIRTHKTGAVIYDRYTQRRRIPTATAIISSGWSHYSEYKFKRYPHMRSIHAEIHALLRTPHRVDLRDAVIYIATVRGKSGTIGLGRPCEICMSLLTESGIKEIIYSDGHGSFIRLDLTNAL